MGRVTLARVLVVALGFAGCGGDDSSSNASWSGGGTGGTTSSGGSSGEPPLGCSSATYCGDDGFICGVHAVASCGEVDCGPCRFRSEPTGLGDITAAPDRSIHLALIDSSTDELVYARVGSSGLERETVLTDVELGSQAGNEVVSIAVADDGTVHIVLASTTVTHAVKAPGDSWQVSTAADEGVAASVEVDAGGVPHILVLSESEVTRQRQLIHVTPDGGAYASTPIPGVAPIQNVEMARGSDGSIVAVVRSDLRAIAVFELIDGEMVRDSSVPELSDQPSEWSPAIASDGTIEIAAVLGNYTLRTGSHLVRLVRSGGSWSENLMDGGDPQVTFGMGMAAGPSDSLHVAYFAYHAGFLYTRAGSPRRLSVEPECDEGQVRMAIDADDQPHLLYDCDRASSTYLAPIERYGNDYIDACNAGAKLICDRACSCGEPDCCYNDGTLDGSNGCTFGPGNAGHALCVSNMLEGLCSDLTADPAAMLACKPVLDATGPQCLEMGYPIPSECMDLIESNR